MSRLCIPTIGTELTLEEDWTFPLHHERRNQKFGKENFGLDLHWSDWDWRRVNPNDPNDRRTEKVYRDAPVITLPKGTVLRVDRVYIRGTSKDYRNYDSVTFRCNTHVTPAKGRKMGLARGRFWAKLIDVNTAEVMFDPMTIPLPEYKELQEAENDDG